ncbi:3'-5' exoribonuclease 1 isoform X1 [Manis pentadactyla]|uniref:3'-5' exoribonuclease 1 isoform X1 n=1 Tax=Manis pentadactyla TaxID=143292 RepID=UPI001874CA31|nr:3'-5' exoribonuclease 1 isoform X1 [Manis pentadactyla]KAI5211174.1 3'-5' Exoribonuclease 1 [Manis pentadactyla]
MESEQGTQPGGEAETPARREPPGSECGEEPRRPNPEKKQRCRFDGQETKGSKFITSNASDFSDPVYKEIAITNGCINRMSKEELRAKLSEFKLETRGVKDVLKKRLKNYYKKQKLMLKEGNCADSYYDYICIIDFEATCEEGNPPEFIHEIIEFPVVLLNTHTLEIEDTFQQYVRPEINTQLSDFCINLTGITQDQVDRADTFPLVLKKVIDWMKLKELGTKYKYSILTDGSWDMSKFLNIQCRLSRLRYPPFAKKWINIRKSYGNFYKVPRSQTKLTIMLEKLGMDYDGRPHSGLDDSKNIARIAVRMLQDGCELRINEKMHAGQLMSVSSSLPIEGTPAPQMPHSKK